MLPILAAIALSVHVPDMAKWNAEASRVTITRDDWGIAHVYGPTDADAVFGMMYAQAEDDFNRIEINYLTSLGWMARAEGEGRVYQDLRETLFYDPARLQVLYTSCPEWLQKLAEAWADGLNFYLAKHPEVKPKYIQHFSPWMVLSFSEGSIGGDVERVDLGKLASFYGIGDGERLVLRPPQAQRIQNPNRSSIPLNSHLSAERGQDGQADITSASRCDSLLSSDLAPGQTRASIAAEDVPQEDKEPGGSNGIALGPTKTRDHHPLLLINPHTSFFFRSEIQVTSGEGLNVYGAVTWGQFFVYQGFNERCGWMHTSSGVDAVDEYLETVSRKNGRFFAKFGDQQMPVESWNLTIPYKTPSGTQNKTFVAFRTKHGPVVRIQGDKWVSVSMLNNPVAALQQSWLRTKSKSYPEFLKTMEFRANSSNNTIFADADGDIAYFHGNFIPRRDNRFDFTKPVDGADPATDWHGLLSVGETPHLLNPASGYVFNVNNWPWAGAGESSLKKQDYPSYVEKGGESARGLHAIRVLKDQKRFTLNSLLKAAFDSYLPWFEKPIPALLKAFDELPKDSPERAKLGPQIQTLRRWNLRWGIDSVATSLAVFWGEQLQSRLRLEARTASVPVEEFAGSKATSAELLRSFSAASERLTRDFGTWNTKWGDINRFQRLTADIEQPFDDKGPSIPVGFTSSIWGSLASFGARPYLGTKKWYGTSGNSFVAAVEFGNRVRAKAVTAGGESGHPGSKHFNDEATRYATGKLRDVYFYPDELKRHIERSYHPGE